MKLYSTEHDSPLKSIKTLSGSTPASIAVTPTGNFAFADCNDKSVNIVKNEKIETVIKLNEWKPRGVCGTSSGTSWLPWSLNNQKLCAIQAPQRNKAFSMMSKVNLFINVLFISQ